MKRFLSLSLVLAASVCVAQEAALQEGEDYVLVCEDAGAGAYEAFPDVVRLQDGRLMTVFYAGYGHVALPNEALPKGGRIVYCLSEDAGRTWSEAQVLYDGPHDDRDPSIAQLEDGTLLCTFFSLERAGEEGYAGLGSWITRSADNGKTWSEPEQLVDNYYCSSPVRQLSDGTLILGLYYADDETAHGAVIRSTDNGATWSAPIDIDNGGLRLDAETDVIELQDGRLYAAQRTRSESMRYSISEDKGLTWSVSKPMGFPGHAPYLYRSPEDVIICAHRIPQTSLHFSTDECATWSESVLVDDVEGSYPSLATLEDGSTIIVYYEEGEGSDIRARRLRGTPEGIVWLKWGSEAQ